MKMAMRAPAPRSAARSAAPPASALLLEATRGMGAPLPPRLGKKEDHKKRNNNHASPWPS